MKGFTLRPDEGSRKPDYFERSKRQRGGSARSYSEKVSSPAHGNAERNRLIILAVITVLLPPVGIICLWRGGFFQFPIRVAATFAAFLLMVLYFSWMIPAKTPDAYQPQLQKPTAVTEYSTGSGEGGV
ncbi:MAG: hypothetical protein IJC48_08615 [Clostridia bacterium]|nr:hypothetical protein [Clostridia bacterium]